MGWSSLPTFTPGTEAKAEDMQTVANDVAFLYGGTDVLRVSLGTGYAVDTAGFIQVDFDTVDEDSANGWNSSSKQYTVQTDGIYSMSPDRLVGSEQQQRHGRPVQLAYQTSSTNPVEDYTKWETMNGLLSTLQVAQVYMEDRFVAGGSILGNANAPGASPIPLISGFGLSKLVVRWVRN